MDVRTNTTAISELAWLSEVRQAGPQLSQNAPISTRHFTISSGPALPHPEYHPYCELGLHLNGAGVEFVEREQAIRKSGDVFIAGPGVPHWFKITSYPLVGIAIYFLPSVLCEFGPERDGLSILRRFTARQSLSRRLVRPPPRLRRRLMGGFEDIHREFTHEDALGSEIRVRTLLLDMLVDILRWERRSGHDLPEPASPLQWQEVNSALHYLREHFAETVYARDVAKAVGVSESRLKVIFRETLGVPWSRYMQGFRIQQAVALLGSADLSITEVALAVGFESLSHFNATFRTLTGLAPSAYVRDKPKTARIKAKTGRLAPLSVS
jgi:AraC-like DNA-binding protein/quercetin dioxygenase-like cupin family protein